MTQKWHIGSVCAALFAIACSSGPVDDDPGPDAGTDIGPPVADLVGDSGCSTEVVLGLSLQIADEIACMDPAALTPFFEGDGIVFNGAAVLPYISAAGLADLEDAIADHGGEIRINSGFRTVVQQYLLHAWFEAGQCGIGAAATPGRSNHETGRALDIDNYQEWAGVLPDYGWEQTVLPSDPVHFDHLPSPDNRGLDILAFQRLWNRNRPAEVIDEDGLYGPMTEASIERSPAGGFAIGAVCRTRAQVRRHEHRASSAPSAPICAH